MDQEASRKALGEYSEKMTAHDHTGSTRPRTEEGHAHANDAGMKLVHGEDATFGDEYSTEVVPGSGGKTRRMVWQDEEMAYEKANTFSLTCTQAACTCCGLYADVPGSFTWKGTGIYSYLNGDTRDPPNLSQPGRQSQFYQARLFRFVPRPPDGWRGLGPEKTDNGGELPSAASPSRLQRVGNAISALLGPRSTSSPRSTRAAEGGSSSVNPP